MPGSAEMPKYQCHKKVWALKIKDIVRITAESFTGGGAHFDGAMIYPDGTGYAPFAVDEAYMTKHKPEVGGYYVVYDDGYKSFSPAKAFEDGYTLIK